MVNKIRKNNQKSKAKNLEQDPPARRTPQCHRRRRSRAAAPLAG